MFGYQNFLPILILIIVLAIVVERTGLFNFFLEQLGKFSYWSIKWLFSVEGSWGSLPQKLAYRDFWDQIVETKNGWFWVGVEIDPLPTDALSNKEKNNLSSIINNFYTVLPPNTRIQHICKINTDASISNTVFNRIVKANPKNVFAPLQLARRNYLLKAGNKGEIKTARTFVFFGRQASEITLEQGWIKSAIKYVQSIYNPKPFLDIERTEFLRVKEELFRIRDTFNSRYKATWGTTEEVVRNLSALEIFQMAWAKLNPEIAERHVPPCYPDSTPKQNTTNTTNTTNTININNISNLNTTNKTTSKPTNKLPSYLNDEPIATYPTLASVPEMLINNPRQLLCQTNVSVEKDYFLFDDKFCMTVSMAQYPTTAHGLMVEILYRDSTINFPIEISTHYTPENKAHRDHKLAKKQNWLRASMRRNNNPDVVEDVQDSQYSAIRKTLTTENLAVGEFGFGITFWANSKTELYRYRDLVISCIQAMNGARANSERHCALDLHLTTLPCTPHGVAGDSTGDFRRRLLLSRDATAFSPWTGAPKGVPAQEAFDIFQGRENNLILWGTNPGHRRFRNGMSLIVGKAGSGKSALLNKLRISWLNEGRVGVSIDYQNSAARLARAVGGIVIDVSKPAQTKGLGLFAIRPRPGEYFDPSELNDEGLPKDAVLEVVEMLEIFCLDDPTKQDERLDPEMVSVLNNAVPQTYARLLQQTPIIDDFIITLRRVPGKEGEIARRLAARLELFARNSGLGHWLNDRSEPLPINTYVVFDLGYVKNARLKLVSSLAINRYLDRFIHNNPSIPKFFDVDEVGEICKESNLSRIIDMLVRTARKKLTVVTVSSQAPTDFDNDNLKGVLANCEVKYFFELADAETATAVLKLTAGQYKAIKTLKPATKDFSEFLITYPSAAPGGGSAIVRMKYCPAEARLVAGAGFELATYDQAVQDLQATRLPINPNLLAALEMAALTGTDRQKTNVAVAS